MKYLHYLFIAAALAVSCKSADVYSITVVPYPSEVSVFGPSRIIISASKNGTDYHQIAEQNFEPLAAIPSWHKHKGKPAYLFVDEIIVK